MVANRLSEEECVTVLLLEAGKAPPKVTDIPAIHNYLGSTELSWRFKTAPLKYAEGIPDRVRSVSTDTDAYDSFWFFKFGNRYIELSNDKISLCQ